MDLTADIVLSVRCIAKSYDVLMKRICERYGLTLLEAQVVTFLYNSPDMNTAADIVKYRLLSKGNVSQAIAGLVRKGYLAGVPNETDRRRTDLFLLPSAAPITTTVDAAMTRLNDALYEGLSEEEIRQYHALRAKIQRNARKLVEESNRRD